MMKPSKLCSNSERNLRDSERRFDWFAPRRRRHVEFERVRLYTQRKEAHIGRARRIPMHRGRDRPESVGEAPVAREIEPESEYGALLEKTRSLVAEIEKSRGTKMLVLLGEISQECCIV